MGKPVILCHYSGKVNELADYKRGGLKWAQTSLKLHMANIRKERAQIVAKGGKPSDDFFFINQTIKSNVQVITISDKDVFETNDPDILKLLAGYIEEPGTNNKMDRLR